METLYTDCLIIGSGLAGSIYAHSASSNNLSCIMLSADDDISSSNSNYAQGGIIYPDPADTETLRKDINRASHNTSNPKAQVIATKYGSKIVKDLLIDKLGIPFDRNPDGSLKLTREAAHSKPDIIYCRDKTGEVILKTVHNSLENFRKLRILRSHIAIDLLTLSHSSKNLLDKYSPLTAMGAYVLDTSTNKIKAIIAKKTILATGGLGQIYLHSTNYKNAFGSGIAMAYRMGARIINMEYIQFHPTAFFKKNAPLFLISEAVRGEGGVLINNRGESFMNRYHPDASLAPRDIVARAIKFETIKAGSDCVYIDTSRMKNKSLKDRFPQIYSNCMKYDVDITTEPIPVVPAAHYFCGGIYTNIYGNTNIQNLNAIGETACTGLHGANRLASSSLLECVVMGHLAAQNDTKSINENRFHLPEVNEWISPEGSSDTLLVKQDLSLIKNTMWNYVGLIRTSKRLERATKILSELKIDIDSFYSNCRLTGDLINLRNAIQCAMLVTYAASKNNRSIGCHYREDG